MVRGPFYDKNGIKRGAWSSEEDAKLKAYVERYGHWNWRELPKFAGLSRCGKSCRLRWLNYLRPDVKRGNYSTEEENLIIKLHEEHGNKWSLIAAELPGRTDNEVKNYWHTHLKKRSRSDHDHRDKNPKESDTSQEISCDSSQCDQTSHSNIEEAVNQAERSTSTTPSNSVPSLQILGGSQSLPVDAILNASSSGSYFSPIENEQEPNIACFGQGDDYVSSSTQASNLDYYYSTGSDFWTEPFLVHKINIPSQTEQDQTYVGGDGGILLPYCSFYDDNMDYLFPQ